MKRSVLNTVLSMILLTLAGLTWALKRDPGQPGYQFIPEMYYSIPYDAQSANPNFADGKTLRVPVAETIPRGVMPLRYAKSDSDAQRAGRELLNPFSKESGTAFRRAEVLYQRFCQSCHGATGLGDGIITRYGFPPPPSFAAPNVMQQPDGQIFHTVTYGKGNMPSLASQIGRDDRWKVILKVRALQRALRARRNDPGAAQ